MSTVASTFGLTAPQGATSRASDLFHDDTVLIGIEHEFERYAGRGDIPADWRAESDGSLRNNGIEFILREPLAGSDLQRAVQAFDAYYQQSGMEINERTSTHVHIDVRNMSVEQYRNFIFTYLLLEDVLFGLCHAARIGNPYCSPLSHSENMRSTFISMLDGHLSGDMFGESLRYGAISLNASRTLGSLEFRMRETVGSSAELVPWINIIMDMRNFAAGQCSPDYMGFLRRAHQRSALQALQYILSDASARYIAENVEDLDERFATGVDVATIFVNL